VWSEGLDKFKKITSSGIKPVTFRFRAYCLNHCATACPLVYDINSASHRMQFTFCHLEHMFSSTDAQWEVMELHMYLHMRIETDLTKQRKAFRVTTPHENVHILVSDLISHT
jgi:hypothetical protein